jgi:type II secretory pathway pseudopilin PulG
VSFSLKEQGITLLEIMLVLAIAASFLMVGLRQYQLLQKDQDAQEVRYNVDRLFQALSHFYRVNCRIPSGGSASSSSYGMLDPSHNPVPTNPFVVTITSMLSTPGYLADWPFPDNSIASSSQYVTQFSRSTSTRYIYTYSPQQGITTPSTPQPIAKANSVIQWRAQVALDMKTPALAQLYKGVLNADCISTTSGSGVLPCPGDALGTWLVWERLPSFASPELTSSLWVSLPVLNQFNNQYTNDDNYAFTIDDTTWNTQSGYETYLCGG